MDEVKGEGGFIHYIIRQASGQGEELLQAILHAYLVSEVRGYYAHSERNNFQNMG